MGKENGGGVWGGEQWVIKNKYLRKKFLIGQSEKS
jgi:hypothetical protein